MKKFIRASEITGSILTRKTNFHFPFPFAANKWKFAISDFCFQQTNGSCHFPLVPFAVYVYMYTENGTVYLGTVYTYTYTYIYCCLKQKKEIHLPFAHCTNGSFVICPIAKKQMKVIRLQRD